MVLARDLVAHILLHVNAEAADRDPSQTAGVAARAQYLRNAVQAIATDTRKRSRDVILLDISDRAAVGKEQASFQRAIANMLGDSRPQIAIQHWVGRASERG